MEIEVLAIDMLEEPIELCKLLKIANLVSGGGEAKMVISQGYVYLNGEVELQKRKKIYFEDIVQFNGEAIMPVLADPAEVQAQAEAEKEKQLNNSLYQDIQPEIDHDPYNAIRNTSANTSAKASPKSGNKSAKGKAKGKNEPKPAKKTKETSNIDEIKSKNKNPRTGRKSISF